MAKAPPRKTVPAVYICMASSICEPCERDLHTQCSLDGMPDCACEQCPSERKAANLQWLDEEVARGTAAQDEAGGDMEKLILLLERGDRDVRGDH